MLGWRGAKLGLLLRISLLRNLHRSARYFANDGSRSRVVMSFGAGSHGALGLPSSTIGFAQDAYEPIPVPGLPRDVCSLGAGHYHSLAVTSEGDIWAWGRNEENQLGRSLHAARESWSEPRRVEGLDEVKVRAAFASGVISVAVGEDGSLWVWGKSQIGQLGVRKEVIEAIVPCRINALATEKIVKVSLGWGHALALTHNGKLFGWGYASEGRLGHIGKEFDQVHDIPLDKRCLHSNLDLEISEKLVMEVMEKEKNMPIIWEPSLLREEVADMACGLDHSLILCCDGTLLSGGSNEYGQLGREVSGHGFLPVEVCYSPLSVAAGLGHSYAISGRGGVVSWGWNLCHQLGRGGSHDVPMLVDALDGKRVVSVSGGRVHSIALTDNGELYVWGCGRSGRLGLGHSADEVEPTIVESLENVEILQAVSGFDHNLILVAE